MDKIVKIQANIATQQDSISDLQQLRCEINQLLPNNRLTDFTPTTIDEIRIIVKSMSNATCDLDPIPTDLLKDCIDEIAPHLCHIVNLSLQSAHVPSDLKMSLVKPLIKKKSLDPDNYKNYRPVSNLSFLSKLIEKIVCKRIESYLEDNSLFPPMQSAYRKKHSTETALLKIVNDILSNMDKGKMSALILLDLSSAFDTIHHGVLLSRLKDRFGIDGLALKWIESYLSGRKQTISLQGYPNSATRSLDWGVPQGSILGPLLFSLYTAPLGDIASEHGLKHHFYADDAQIYNIIENAQCLKDLQNCVNDYRKWMIANYLKVNDEKTELLLLGSPYNFRKKHNISLFVGESEVFSVDMVTNLGVILDKTLSMSDFIDKKCSTCWFYLKSIAKVRKFLTIDATKCLVQALIVSRVDYCNSVLSGISRVNMRKLQLIQNAAARLIYRKKKFDHITPVLFELHWLPIPQRIIFKVLMYVYNVKSNDCPRYLSNLLVPAKSTRNLRSTKSIRFDQRKVKTKYGLRAFANYGPELWNSIPDSIKNAQSLFVFKGKLKTFLFQQAYGCD